MSDERGIWVVEVVMNQKKDRWAPAWGEFFSSRQATIRAMRSTGVTKDNHCYRPAYYTFKDFAGIRKAGK